MPKPFSQLTPTERAKLMVLVSRGKGVIVDIPYIEFVVTQTEVSPAKYSKEVVKGEEPVLIKEAVYEETVEGLDLVEHVYIGELPVGTLADLIGDLVALFTDGLSLKAVTEDPSNLAFLEVLNGSNASYLIARISGLDADWVKENVYLEQMLLIIQAFFQFHKDFFSLKEMFQKALSKSNISEEQVKKLILGQSATS